MSRPRRIDRLNELFRRELSRLVRGDLKDPRVQGVVVTAVRTSGDLSFASVYVRSEPPVPVEEAIDGMDHAAGYIRRELGRELHLRKVPEFRFVADETLEHAERIEELLRRTREEEGAGGPPDRRGAPDGDRNASGRDG